LADFVTAWRAESFYRRPVLFQQFPLRFMLHETPKRDQGGRKMKVFEDQPVVWDFTADNQMKDGKERF
jgi:hypothetical protein